MAQKCLGPGQDLLRSCLREQLEKNRAFRGVGDLVRNAGNASFLNQRTGVDILRSDRHGPANQDYDQPNPFPHGPTLYKRIAADRQNFSPVARVMVEQFARYE